MAEVPVALTLSADTLRGHLQNESYSCEWLFQSYVVQKRAHVFAGGEEGYRDEMAFRAAVAQAVGVSIGEVTLVGSAQLGFSVKPGAPYRGFDQLHEENARAPKSDIDVAIVSRKYFDATHEAVSNFTRNFKKSWKTNKYYPEPSKIRGDVKRADYNFLAYLAMGWIRPDFAPEGYEFEFSDVKDVWRAKLKRKVSFAIYRDWKVLEAYQVSAFKDLRMRILEEP